MSLPLGEGVTRKRRVTDEGKGLFSFCYIDKLQFEGHSISSAKTTRLPQSRSSKKMFSSVYSASPLWLS